MIQCNQDKGKEVKIMERKEEKRLAVVLGEFTGQVISCFITVGFIYWGWTVLAPHLNAPLFTYWEVFAIRMAVSSVMAIFWQKKGIKN